MPLFISPDRTQYPLGLDLKPDNNLEAVTGCDLIITPFPLKPSVNIKPHIEKQALFVQIKIGYDICSFDALKNASSRIQQCQIPMPQAVLLFVGKAWQDDAGLLRIENNKPFGTTTYKTFQKVKRKWIGRGGVYDHINSIHELPLWIEAQQEAIEDMQKEGKREIYPNRPMPMFEIDNVWQLVEELDKNTIAYFLCAGLDGVGQKTIQNIYQYFQDELPHLHPDGYYVLKVLTDMESEKLVHNVKGWGKGKASHLRRILMLPDGVNLSINGKITDDPYRCGWMHALDTFKQLIDEGHTVKDSFNAVRKAAKELIEF